MNYKDTHIIDLLVKRVRLETKIELENGNILSVWNIAWGYDIADEFAHITTNISPGVDNASIDFFYSNEIKRIFDDKNRDISVAK